MEAGKHIVHELAEQFCEEIEDANKYLDLAAEADEDGMRGTAKALRMIAREEMTHAKFLRDDLRIMHHFDTEKEEKWEKLLSRMEH